MVNISQMEIWKKYVPCRVAARAKTVKEHIFSVYVEDMWLECGVTPGEEEMRWGKVDMDEIV